VIGFKLVVVEGTRAVIVLVDDEEDDVEMDDG
jgi:hypothetical protein